MKFGMRKPSIKKSFKARTTSKYKRAFKKSVNPFYGKKGIGFIKNPKKSIYNKVYHKTTFGIKDLIYIPKNSNNKSRVKYKAKTNNSKKIFKDIITNEDKEFLELHNNFVLKNSNMLDNGYKKFLNDLTSVEIQDNKIYIYDLSGDLFFKGELTKDNQKKVYRLYKKINKSNFYPYKSYYEIINNLPEGSSKKPLKIFKFVNLPLSIFLLLLASLININSFTILSIVFLAITIYGLRIHRYSFK
ncbi:hypothetical protein [uncultured Peptoniphilus sp.]|uniref:hypothetical protein n=1 Tax=uncultured Peptoniphilus sp. TaxID=254354 RepID=UPI0025D622BE|nr:hypothetical protein [uncultured Peptoniphilus sp.]